jgi:protein O-mannosyl-transferase
MSYFIIFAAEFNIHLMWKFSKTPFSNLTTDINTDKLLNNYLQYLILSGIMVLTIIIYSGTFKNEFTWDDEGQVEKNIDIKNLNAENVLKIFSSNYIGMYQPFPTLTFAVEYKFFGLNPGAYHITNLIFHLLNIILVYLLFLKLTKRYDISYLAAILFAIHPMNSESVSWVSCRSNLIYSLFYLGSLIFYLRYIQNKYQDTSIKTEENLKYEVITKMSEENKYLAFSFNKNYLFSLLLFILSLLSKPMAVTLPVILILSDYYINSSKFKVQSLKYWLDKIPFFILALGFGIIALISEKITNSNTNSLIHYSLFNRFFILIYSLSFYIVNLVAPLKLSAIHPSPEIEQGFLPLKYYLSPLLIILITFIIFVTKKTRKEMIFGTLFFLITISVTLIAGKVRYSEVAERYTYISYLGLFFILAQSVNLFKFVNLWLKIIKYFIIILILILFSILTYNRNKVWQNNISLFDDVIEKYPRAVIALNNRGLAKYHLKDYYGAIQDNDKALEINPKEASVYVERGNSKKALGDYKGAIQDYNKAIEINPRYGKAYYNRGYLKASSGDMQGAINDFNRAIEINPKDEDAYNNRGNAIASLGDMRRAINDFNRAIEISSQNAEPYNNRGNAKYFLRDVKGAIEDYNKVIELNPQYGDAYNNRGMAKFQSGDKVGACSDWRKAVEFGKRNAFEMMKRYCQ